MTAGGHGATYQVGSGPWTKPISRNLDGDLSTLVWEELHWEEGKPRERENWDKNEVGKSKLSVPREVKGAAVNATWSGASYPKNTSAQAVVAVSVLPDTCSSTIPFSDSRHQIASVLEYLTAAQMLLKFLCFSLESNGWIITGPVDFRP